MKRENGGLAQLGEHLLCKQGVKGSIPLISTNREPRYLKKRIIGSGLTAQAGWFSAELKTHVRSKCKAHRLITERSEVRVLTSTLKKEKTITEAKRLWADSSAG